MTSTAASNTACCTRGPTRRGFARVAGVLLAAALVLPACVATPGCGEAPAPAGFERVTINDRTFTLELALDDATRTQGLSGRASIPADGGMLFVFPKTGLRFFVMRDCLVPIDIIYLDASGRITAMHAMQVEPPRGEGEGQPGETNIAYESRLKKYASRFSAQFAIELAGGTLESLELEPGDLIELDLDRLKDLAK